MLEEKIRTDLNSALKSREELKVSTLRMLLSSLNYLKIEKQTDLTDEDVISVLQKEVKKHNESIESFKKGNRQDLVDKETKELEILKTYLPAQLTQGEIEKFVAESISETGAKSQADFGLVMKSVMPKLRGRADGSLVSQLVKQKLTP